ncbi:hypothetical protein GCM10009827_105150 [Dactylosporangium maewongense]|uniref:Uncharacterized protein n=1 Tax=Dactylosporangium maewongense TaxID=634393 RepID=A0ABP4NRK7_9ACTN
MNGMERSEGMIHTVLPFSDVMSMGLPGGMNVRSPLYFATNAFASLPCAAETPGPSLGPEAELSQAVSVNADAAAAARTASQRLVRVRALGAVGAVVG